MGQRISQYLPNIRSSPSPTQELVPDGIRTVSEPAPTSDVPNLSRTDRPNIPEILVTPPSDTSVSRAILERSDTPDHQDSMPEQSVNQASLFTSPTVSVNSIFIIGLYVGNIDFYYYFGNSWQLRHSTVKVKGAVFGYFVCEVIRACESQSGINKSCFSCFEKQWGWFIRTFAINQKIIWVYYLGLNWLLVAFTCLINFVIFYMTS